MRFCDTSLTKLTPSSADVRPHRGLTSAGAMCYTFLYMSCRNSPFVSFNAIPLCKSCKLFDSPLPLIERTSSRTHKNPKTASCTASEISLETISRSVSFSSLNHEDCMSNWLSGLRPGGLFRLSNVPFIAPVATTCLTRLINSTLSTSFPATYNDSHHRQQKAERGTSAAFCCPVHMIVRLRIPTRASFYGRMQLVSLCYGINCVKKPFWTIRVDNHLIDHPA